jgi:hypothetical protein
MSYNPLGPVNILVAASLGANITSNPVNIKNQDNVGVQLHWTGTPVGTFGVQISSNHIQDPVGNVLFEGNWVTLPLSPAITAVGSGDDAYIDLNQMSAQWVKVIYTRTSGTGSVDAVTVAKGV